MEAIAKRVDSLYCVMLAGEIVATYSSPVNAKLHKDAINSAIKNPPNLNQKPKFTFER